MEKDNQLLLEAIKHALEIFKKYKEDSCNAKCAQEHKKLASWLTELYLRRTGKSVDIS